MLISVRSSAKQPEKKFAILNKRNQYYNLYYNSNAIIFLRTLPYIFMHQVMCT